MCGSFSGERIHLIPRLYHSCLSFLQGKARLMSLLSLEFDELAKIATFLTLTEVQHFSATNTKIRRNVGQNALFWQEYLRARYGYYLMNTGGGKTTYAFRNHFQQLVQQLEYDMKSSKIDSSQTNKQIAKHLHLLDGLRYVVSDNCELDSEYIWEMEGHSGALVLDRFWIIVSGWPRDEHFDNSALCLDLGHHNCISDDINPTDFNFTLKDVFDRDIKVKPVLVHNTPRLPIQRFTYGFTVTSMCLPGELDYLYNDGDKNPPNNYTKRLVLFGGLTLGGYRGDVNGLYILDVTFKESGITAELSDIEAFTSNRPISAHAKWSSNMTPARPSDPDMLLPITRGYHTANVIAMNGGRRSLVLFGGLHQHQPCNSLEIYDIETNKWVYNGSTSTASSYVVAGARPSNRFGHSTTLVGNKLYVCGGSDGNDLIRNGSELKDLYILEFSHEHNKLAWSQPINPTNFTNAFYPGRCHTATVLGDKIIFFGGDADHSNDLVVFDTKTQEISLPELCVDEDTQIIPRMSAIAVSRGVKLFIFGGFNQEYGQLGDAWQVDLAFDLISTKRPGVRLMSEVESSDGDSEYYEDD